jgi:hypothetical protein
MYTRPRFQHLDMCNFSDLKYYDTLFEMMEMMEFQGHGLGMKSHNDHQ